MRTEFADRMAPEQCQGAFHLGPEQAQCVGDASFATGREPTQGGCEQKRVRRERPPRRRIAAGEVREFQITPANYRTFLRAN